VQDCARELDVSRDTIERLIGAGALQAVAIRTPSGRGRRRRFRIKREWLERFLLEQCEGSRPAKKPPAARPPYHGPDFVG
jgi:excisionase family DNA binding protein